MWHTGDAKKKPKVYLASPEKFFLSTFLMNFKLSNIVAAPYLQLFCKLDLYSYLKIWVLFSPALTG